MNLFMHLCERKKSFIKMPTLILYLKLQALVYLQIWNFDVTGWVGLERSFILMQTAGRFDM